MPRLIIFLLTIIQLNFNSTLSPSFASVDYIMRVTTRGQNSIPVRQKPDYNAIVIHRLSDGQGVAICSQCDRNISFRDPEGVLWWEIWYVDSSGNQSRGFAEDQYLLLIDGGGCPGYPLGTATLGQCMDYED